MRLEQLQAFLAIAEIEAAFNKQPENVMLLNRLSVVKSSHWKLI